MRSSIGLAMAVASVALANGAAAARFAPPMGKTLRQTITEERRDGASILRFSVERRLTFSTAPEGYTLDIVTDRISEPGNSIGAMFAAGLAAMIGKTIRFRLDAYGTVTSIDDEAAIWAALCDGVDGMARGPGSLAGRRQGNVRSMGGALRALPPERRRAMLASLVATVVAGPLADRAVGDNRVVSVPGRSVAGHSAALTGREQVSESPDAPGQSMIETALEGNVALPDAPSGPPATLRVAIRQRVDRATGLIVESQETRETVIDDRSTARGAISLTSTRLEPMVF